MREGDIQMHEMSIAQSILQIVAAEAKKAGVDRVAGVELDIGKLAGIEYPSLEFAMKVIAPGTAMDSCRLIINKPDGKARCNDCHLTFTTGTNSTPCPGCGSYSYEITGGREFSVRSILID